MDSRDRDTCNQSSCEPEVTAYLKLRDGSCEAKHETIPLKGIKVSIGRTHNNDICLKRLEISRNHCVFSYLTDTNKWSIVDLSRNGIIVNERGCKKKPVELSDGDFISLIPAEPMLTYEFREVSCDDSRVLDTDASSISSSSTDESDIDEFSTGVNSPISHGTALMRSTCASFSTNIWENTTAQNGPLSDTYLMNGVSLISNPSISAATNNSTNGTTIANLSARDHDLVQFYAKKYGEIVLENYRLREEHAREIRELRLQLEASKKKQQSTNSNNKVNGSSN